MSCITYDAWDLRYATCAAPCNGGAWQLVTIDTAGAVGWGNALAVEGSGTLHVAGFDHTNGTVRYGRCAAACVSPANWAFGVVAQVADPGINEPRGFYHVRMTAHASGITLAYQDRRTGALFTADCAASCAVPAWTIRRVSRLADLSLPTAFEPTLLVDPAGTHHIVFSSGLRYARF